MNNNNLIVFLLDGTKHVLTFSSETDEEQALSFFENLHPEARGVVKKYFYIKEDTIPPQEYKDNYFLSEEGLLDLNVRKMLIEKSTKEIIRKRDFFLKNLDLPFMRSLEDDDLVLRNHIKTMKNFLRDLPENLRYADIKENSDIMKYDPFGNIFTIELLDTGSGYTSPPSVTIDDPKGEVFGFTAKAVASIENGGIKEIRVIDYGSGYNYAPSVTIDASENGETAIAANALPQNIALSSEEIIENTKLVYNL